MKDVNYILDTPLPIGQDFKLQKDHGLQYIQEISSSEWTNLNPSDPGVTILDQICFALTELGYCNDFPIKDILTDEKGKLIIENQFYLPHKILTTSPINIEDYRKYIIDGIECVKNIKIIPSNHNSPFSGTYKSYLYVDDGHLPNSPSENTATQNDICQAVFFLLNSARNISENFLMPKVLIPKTYEVSGQLDLSSTKKLKSTLLNLQQAINNYIFPTVRQLGYEELKKMHLETNEIFNGPLLRNGWIPSDALGDKKETLNTVEVNQIVGLISGIQLRKPLSFKSGSSRTKHATSLENEILNIDIIQSVKKSSLKLFGDGKEISQEVIEKALSFIQKPSPIQGKQSVSAIKLAPDPPKGKFRDIEDYYSIQNTFPQIYKVGENAITDKTPSLEIAQSRQLKGYLTLYDQVLANQFSQLANLDKLFSFKNSSSGTPSQLKNFYRDKDTFTKKHLEYPVPFLTFSPTYFYQPLYKAPDIWPLLKNDHTFNFSSEPESKQEQEINSWKEYKNDPYNPYVWGLKLALEDNANNLERRNAILDHLLARHGESPNIINTFVEGSYYTNNDLENKVIFKSLYLQNLQLLSYFRIKGYNYLAAKKLSTDDYKTILEDFIKILQSYIQNGTLRRGDFNHNINGYKTILTIKELLNEYQTDFIFDSEKVDRIEKLYVWDTIEFSTLELKLNLLFGLKVQYATFILEKAQNFDLKNLEHSKTSNQLKIALWLLLKQKGILLIETNLLMAQAKYQLILTNEDEKTYWSTKPNLGFQEAQELSTWLNTSQKNEISEAIKNGLIEYQDTEYPLSVSSSSKMNKDWFKPISNSSYKLVFNALWGNHIETYVGHPIFNNGMDLFIPNFIPEFNTAAFENKLKLFLGNMTPIHTNARYHLVSDHWLNSFIPEFIDWHNAMIFKGEKNNDEELTKKAGVLASKIIEINKPHATK